MKKVEIKSRKPIFDDFFRVEEAVLRYEKFDGRMSEEVRRLSFERGDSVAAIVVNTDTDRVILINQFRYPAYAKGPGWLLELVAGTLEPGEDPADAMRREIHEEIGFLPQKLEHISTFYLSPGGSSERIVLYYAEVNESQHVSSGGGAPGEAEDIETLEVSKQELMEWLDSGKLTDAKTLVGVLWLKTKQGK